MRIGGGGVKVNYTDSQLIIALLIIFVFVNIWFINHIYWIFCINLKLWGALGRERGASGKKFLHICDGLMGSCRLVYVTSLGLAPYKLKYSHFFLFGRQWCNNVLCSTVPWFNISLFFRDFPWFLEVSTNYNSYTLNIALQAVSYLAFAEFFDRLGSTFNINI